MSEMLPAMEAEIADWRAAAPVPANTGREPTYLVRYAGQEGWREASEEAYHLFSEGNRRIMYAAPVAARELDADAKRRAFENAAKEHGLDIAKFKEGDIGAPPGTYVYCDTQSAWVMWQVRATAESAPVSAAPPKPPQAT